MPEDSRSDLSDKTDEQAMSAFFLLEGCSSSSMVFPRLMVQVLPLSQLLNSVYKMIWKLCSEFNIVYIMQAS